MSYIYQHPHPAVTADCIVFSADGKVLLIERGNEPCKGKWAFPGGFMNIDETAEAAAVRELREETGIELDECDIFQVGAYSTVDRDPRERVVTIAFFAEVERPMKVTGRDDAAQAKWFKLSELPPLAFDHAEILEDARLIWEDE